MINIHMPGCFFEQIKAAWDPFPTVAGIDGATAGDKTAVITGNGNIGDVRLRGSVGVDLAHGGSPRLVLTGIVATLLP